MCPFMAHVCLGWWLNLPVGTDLATELPEWLNWVLFPCPSSARGWDGCPFWGILEMTLSHICWRWAISPTVGIGTFTNPCKSISDVQHMGVSIKGYPQSSSISRWDFPDKPSSYWGNPMTMEAPTSCLPPCWGFGPTMKHWPWSQAKPAPQEHPNHKGGTKSSSRRWPWLRK